MLLWMNEDRGAYGPTIKMATYDFFFCLLYVNFYYTV